MKVASLQPRIIPIESEPRKSIFREAVIEPFERLGFGKSTYLISHTLLTFIMGSLAGSNK